MPKPKHTLDGPRRAAAQASLARRQLEIRTLSTLQDHFTTDITRKIVDILNGNSPGHELPQKDTHPKSVARRGKLTSGYKGATKNRNKWRAIITRCGATVNLRSYDEELTAAVVAQVADKEIPELGHMPRKRARPLPADTETETETETESDADYEALSQPMPTRSTYHLETLAENRRLNDEVQPPGGGGPFDL